MVVSVERADRIAVVTVDNPPVNATSHAVRVGLMDAARQLTPDSGVDAVVLLCAGRTFIAGADITEFGGKRLEPWLGTVIDAIADAPVPWVAVIHGTALGGGLEVALGCHWRLAEPSARVGLPEVNLGIIPGAGGTQRLPRLTDPDTAIEIITGGKPIGAERALAAGIIDRLITGDRRAEGIAFARGLVGQPPRRIDPAPARDPGIDWQALRARIAARARGQESPLHALSALREAYRLPLPEGLRREREIILPLFDSPQAQALRHAFFAERAVARPRAIAGATPRPLSRIAVVGGGLMGCGIAASALAAGLQVTLVERDAAAAGMARDRIGGLIDGAVKRGLASPEEAAARKARLTATADYDATAGAELAIEAVFEEVEVKADVFRRLDEAMGPEAILASNTSYIDPREFTRGIRNPGRIMGLHFFSPAHIMRLVEVVRTPQTTPETLATGFALARSMGKVGVLCGICDGFIGNRILSAYGRLCTYLIEDGALPWEVDAAMRGFGWPMGYFEMVDMAGHQIGYARRRRLAATRDPKIRYSRLPDLVFESGREGQRNGRGWYDHSAGKPVPDPEIRAMIEAESARLGIARRSFTPEEITERILAVMANEGAAILAEGVAERPLDIDVVEMLGYGFPRWRGGPMHHADHVGPQAVLATMERVAAESPGSWQVSPLLAEIARTGGRFADRNG
ncbi:MAG: enoyl-CoA hydratase [Paracoccaceae bacterium]|nr:MAG: enoyl-CoA hydratase [Paracoccaceae bacterium]